MVSRDRALAYADGVKQGAPSAVQVADRWHLLRNLSDALERWIARKRRFLRQAATEVAATTAASHVVAPAAEAGPQQPTRRALDQKRREESRAERVALYNEIRELHKQGASIYGLARKYQIHRRVVRLYLRADEFPDRATPKRKASILDPFLPYLRQKWEEGHHNATELAREIKRMGFRGAESLVRHYMVAWRAALPTYERCVRRLKSGPPPKRVRAPSPHAAVWLLTNGEEKLTDEQRQVLAKLVEICPEMRTAQNLVQRFQRMVSERKAAEFDDWLTDATKSRLPEIQNFAAGLKRDAAVRAALELEWSNGQVEGRVNKLKMLKRQMFGRANFDILKIRVLHAQ